MRQTKKECEAEKINFTLRAVRIKAIGIVKSDYPLRYYDLRGLNARTINGGSVSAPLTELALAGDVGIHAACAGER